jgi:hypothetical protein
MSYILVINEFVRAAKTKGAITIFGGSQIGPFCELTALCGFFVKD